jgi:tetratricopeptide (TPR) repeat protein
MLRTRLLAALLLLFPVSACRPKVESTTPLFTRSVSTADAPVETLSLSVTYTFADDGTYTRVERHRYRLLTESGVQSWGTISSSWAPWYEDRPQLAATVKTPDGSEVALDPTTITAGPASTYSERIFSDAQVLRAPLPALTVGAEVEEVITMRTTKALPWPQVHVEGLQGLVKRGSFEVVIDAPAKTAIHHLVDGSDVKAREEVAGGRRRVVWSAKDLPGLEFPEAGPPSDIHYLPRLVFRTHDRSWRDVAKVYAGLVDEALADFKVPPAAQAIVDAKASREQKIAGLLEWVHDRVRYTGLELGMSTVVPTRPATVLSRGYGDCKDQATMLVGLLRAAGIDADVALLNAGYGADISPTFPGISEFNHAIVVVRGPKPLWIDPTAEYARAGQLPGADRGRLALIAARDADAPVPTPRAGADDNTHVETRTITLAEFGKARVREELTATGELELGMRENMAGTRKGMTEGLERYAKSEYEDAKLISFDVTPAVDLTQNFRLSLDVDKAGVADTELVVARVDIDWGPLWHFMPSGIFASGDDDDDDEDKKTRKLPLAVRTPFDVRLNYRIKLPPGFEAELPKFQPVDLSPVLLERSAARDGNDITVALRVRLDGDRLTPEQVNAFRKAVKELDKQDAMQVVAVHKVVRAYDRKDLPGALALVAQEAKTGSAIGRLRLADTLGTAHLRTQALAEIRAVLAADPNHALAHAMLGDRLREDRFGRQHGQGWDRAGAIEAAVKAAELDEEYKRARINAAHDAEVGDLGGLFGAGSDLARAAELWATIEPETFAASNNGGLANNELLVLWHLERHDAIDRWMARRGADAPGIGKLMQAWKRGGTAGVLEEVRRDKSTSSEARATDLAAMFGLLMNREPYPELAKMADATNGLGLPDLPALTQMRTIARTIIKADAVVAAATGPKRVYVDMVEATLKQDPQAVDRAVEALLSTRVHDRERTMRALLPWRRHTRQAPMQSALRLSRDLLLAGASLTSEGSDALGHRVIVNYALGNMTDKPVDLFLVREGKDYKIRAVSTARTELAREAAARLAAGDVKGGRQWLTWYFEGARRTDAHELMQPPAVLLWADGKADPALVAQVALVNSDERDIFKALVAARAKLKDDDPTAALVDHAIARTAGKADVAHGKRALANLKARYPGAEALVTIELDLAWVADDWKQYDRLMQDYLARVPKAYAFQRRWAQSFVQRGDFARAIERLVALQGEGAAQENDFNNMAWWSLFAGNGVPDERALEWAVRAAANDDAADVHTLGCVQAAMGRTLEALETFDRLVTLRKEIDLDDEYLLAEIHRQLGYVDEAREVYARLAKLDQDDPSSTAELARRRLKTLKAR